MLLKQTERSLSHISLFFEAKGAVEPFQTQINEAAERALVPPGEGGGHRSGPSPGLGRESSAEPFPGLGPAPKGAKPGESGEKGREQAGTAVRGSRECTRGARPAPHRTCAASIPERTRHFPSKRSKSNEEKGFSQLRARDSTSFPSLGGKKGRSENP